MTLFTALAGLTAYFLGSVPTSVWYGKAFFGIDIRQHGSGNAGASNTFRILGKKAGIVVLFVDIFKGWIATSLALILFFLGEMPEQEILPYKLLFGILAVTGHLLPIFAEFKGGKGVATLAGVIIALHPQAALACILIFGVLLWGTGYISVASMLTSLAFPLMFVFKLFGEEPILLSRLAWLGFAVIVYTHRKNIVRLMKGEENRLKPSPQKNK